MNLKKAYYIYISKAISEILQKCLLNLLRESCFNHRSALKIFLIVFVIGYLFRQVTVDLEQLGRDEL